MADQSLIDMQKEYQGVMNEIMEMGGEITPDQEAAIEALVQDRIPQKIEGYMYIEKKLEADAEFFKAEAKKLTDAARVLMNSKVRLHERILNAMVLFKEKTLQGHRFEYFRYPCAERLVVDPELLSQDWKLQEIKWLPDKQRIKEALKEMTVIPGAKLEGGWSLKIRAKKDQK